MTALYVGPAREDRVSLEKIFRPLGWTLGMASTAREALRRLARRLPPVVICNRDLPDGTWHLFLTEFEKIAFPPRLVVSCRLADDRLWAEVLNLGGFDVLSTPFDGREVQHVVSYARDSRERDRAGLNRRHARQAIAGPA